MMEDIADLAKHEAGISTPDELMSEDDITKVLRSVGEAVSRQARIQVMLSLTLERWPRFYEKYSLAQWN
jgi:hypothetical protein